MSGQGATRRLPPLHPLLMGVYPIAFLYQANADEVTIGQVLGPLLATVGAAGALTVALLLILKDAGKAALGATLMLAFFFSYGHIKYALTDAVLGPFRFGGEKFLVPVLGGAFMFLGWRVLRARRTVEANKIVTVVLVVLVVMSAMQVVAGGGARAAATTPAGEPVLEPLDPAALERARDIYYLVFDRYTSDTILRRKYGFDNSPFLDGLRRRGFSVIEDGQANYVNTLQSLASSMNMQHLGPLTEDAPGDHWGPARELLTQHLVGRSLARAGYEYHHIGSWSEMSRVSPIAHRNHPYDGRSEFVRVLLRTTAWPAIAKAIGRAEDDHRAEHRAIALHQFRILEDLAEQDAARPRFVFAHILMPHPPYVFDRRGREVTPAQQKRRGRKRNYVEQLRYTNARIEQVLDRLFDGPDEQDPIVILQADEGMYPTRWLEMNTGYAQRPTAPGQTADELREKYGILNAVYIPGARAGAIPEHLTPVNTFRIVFNEAFGTSLPLLPDRRYIFRDDRRRYDFTDITEQVTR